MPKANTRDVTTIACEICLREIPHSVGRSGEGLDYVYYFCGDVCYSQWTQGLSKEEFPPPTVVVR